MSMSGKTTTSTATDPAVTAKANANYDKVEALSEEPYVPYGTTLDLAPSAQAATGLLDYSAPYIAASTLNRSNVRDVDGGSVSAADIAAFMNPYTNDVVNASMSDLTREQQIENLRNSSEATMQGAWGTTGAAVQKSLTDDNYTRAKASSSTNLRSAGYNTALSAAQTEAARQLQAAMANQGVDMTVEQANATLQQQAAQANQSASISSAGVRSNAAGLLGDLTSKEYAAGLAEYQREQDRPLVLAALRNSTLGTIPVANSTTQKTTPGLLDYMKVGAQAASTAVAASDGRLKEDIETIRTDEEGRRWVSYRYKWDEPDTRREGLIAQEVEQIEPWRVSTMPSGFKAVDYAGLI